MSQPRAGTEPRRPAGSIATRIGRAWRVLPPERRLAALACFGLFVTLFLPWYQETVIAGGRSPRLQSASASLTGWGAFSFVEAAVLMVAVGVLVLLFVRAEGAAFHVPGGDGGVITAAGFWAGVLIVWRIFDKSGTTGHAQYATTSGIEWGIFIALGVAALLAYAGSRIRRAHEPEPPLPGEPPGAAERPAPGRSSGRGARRPRAAQPESPVRAQYVTPPPSPAPEIRPHRPRVERERAASRGFNFSDLDQIRFEEPPEVPTVRRRSASFREHPTVPRPDPEEEPTIAQQRRVEPEDEPTIAQQRRVEPEHEPTTAQQRRVEPEDEPTLRFD